MKFRSIVHTFTLAVLLAGCVESNPLEKHPSEQIASVLLKESKVPLAKCAKIWSHPEAASTVSLAECEPMATQTAILLNEKGFGPGITAQNVQLPRIWPQFLKQLEVHQENLKKEARKAYNWNSR